MGINGLRRIIIINNIVQIVESIAMNEYNSNIENDSDNSKFGANLTNALVSAISIGNFSGCLIS